MPVSRRGRQPPAERGERGERPNSTNQPTHRLTSRLAVVQDPLSHSLLMNCETMSGCRLTEWRRGSSWLSRREALSRRGVLRRNFLVHVTPRTGLYKGDSLMNTFAAFTFFARSGLASFQNIFVKIQTLFMFHFIWHNKIVYTTRLPLKATGKKIQTIDSHNSRGK